MEQVQVEITGMVITNRYGSLSSGTILRTDAAFAKHLVEECNAAKYVKTAVKAVDEQKAVNASKPAKKPAKVTANEPVAESGAPESTEETAAAVAAQADTPAE